MDPAVIAALITTPTAVLAAAVAYAAGRAQARAAHRGPVDAVRRQHQREAYAALVAEVAKYENHMFRVYLGTINPGMQRHWNDTLTTQDNEALVFAAAAVRLEGPLHLADLAHGLELASNHVYGAVLELQHAEDPVASPANNKFDERHNTLKERAKTFVEAASAHLNNSRGRS
ncbi:MULTISPECIES: hypothetical protein [unclassified Streptomyces]|uniref:hypothetical protein n=1 Tax=unclassified Streptomyces TaxID=2593676 RepID=UPI00236671B8|nr:MULTISPECIES: hypothetical protein [unclassified Streptomyces]MDF3142137.1 hypothetical protein [Streptomyces sp. T21Q-yed]WDF43582.1 hypothetical protein PBV52_45800 [Streptomyces sp. T12]